MQPKDIESTRILFELALQRVSPVLVESRRAENDCDALRVGPHVQRPFDDFVERNLREHDDVVRTRDELAHDALLAHQQPRHRREQLVAVRDEELRRRRRECNDHIGRLLRETCVQKRNDGLTVLGIVPVRVQIDLVEDHRCGEALRQLAAKSRCYGRIRRGVSRERMHDQHTLRCIGARRGPKRQYHGEQQDECRPLACAHSRHFTAIPETPNRALAMTQRFWVLTGGYLYTGRVT